MWALHTNKHSTIKVLTVDLSIVYIPNENQPVIFYSGGSSCLLIIDQLYDEFPTPLQSSRPNMTPHISVNGNTNLISLQINFTKH